MLLTLCTNIIGDVMRTGFWSNHALPHIVEDQPLASTKTPPTYRREHASYNGQERQFDGSAADDERTAKSPDLKARSSISFLATNPIHGTVHVAGPLLLARLLSNP